MTNGYERFVTSERFATRTRKEWVEALFGKNEVIMGGGFGGPPADSRINGPKQNKRIAMRT